MLGRSAHWEVPRRVVVHYLLFCLVVVAWLTAGVVIVCQCAVRDHQQDVLLSFVGRAASAATIEYLQHGAANLQSLVERLAREQGLLWCAISSPEGRYLAHTVRGRVGHSLPELKGQRRSWGPIEAVRSLGGSGEAVEEFRAPLDAGGRVLGTLHVAVNRAGWWRALEVAAEHAPLTLISPFAWVVMGAIVLGRIVAPLAAVESQLRHAALASSFSEADLRPVQAATPIALGWNRLIRQCRGDGREGALDRRLSQALQARRKEKADEILNSLSEGVAVTDHEGRIRFANRALESLLALDGSGASLDGKTLEELLALPVESEACQQFRQPELRARILVQDVARQLPGGEQFLRVTRSPIRSAEQGAKGGHVWSVRDITQQRLADRMRDQFLDAATHELRTPLANIRAYAETLALSDTLDVERQKEFCNTINAEAGRLSRFIDDLLNISSMEMGALALDRQDVELERLFREVVHKVKPQMELKKINFHCVFPEKYPQASLDKDKLTVALVNVLGNAAKYTPEGGRVGFRVQVVDQWLRVDVEDTGIGISEEELPRVFDKFFRSSNPQVQEQPGSGLGLSMAQEVLRLHGGELTVESQLGAGSRFTATLPLG